MVMDVIDQVYLQPFEWGRSDCCTRACDVFRALHGVDPMAPLRGRYDGPVGAARLIRSFGGWSAMCSTLAAGAGLIKGAGGPGSALGLVQSGARDFALSVAVPDGWAVPIDCGVVVVSDVKISWGLNG